jgi:hypothetical protein
MLPHDIARIGIIIAGSAPPIEGFKEGLGEFGLVVGQNIHFELRVAQGQLDRLPEFCAEIVRLDVDVIAVIGAVKVRAACNATPRRDRPARLTREGRPSDPMKCTAHARGGGAVSGRTQEAAALFQGAR